MYSKNKIWFIFPILLIIFSFNFHSLRVEAMTNKPGDIIVTKNTSSYGIAGHTGIFISSNQILHTSGWKNEPYPIVFTKKQWEHRYGNSKVVRPKSASLGKKAASNAKKYFKDKKIPYSVGASLKSTKRTYCSQLVWYSYYKAGKTYKVYKQINSGSKLAPKYAWVLPDKIMPYDFVSNGYPKGNGFVIVDNTWSRK
ncbi:C40 family peptidase [Rummeliibacillus pycnus]|uniref:hypothetical protein n=1 Tax=Rummeliibacillus pycnus TaxID=101070 RepID=UPI000C9C2896|nr:hypothetical protein [Rummeliibacillus pycnus]